MLLYVQDVTSRIPCIDVKTVLTKPCCVVPAASVSIRSIPYTGLRLARVPKLAGNTNLFVFKVAGTKFWEEVVRNADLGIEIQLVHDIGEK